MPQLDQSKQNADRAEIAIADTESATPSQPARESSASNPTTAPMTQAQADTLLAEVRSIKKNIFFLLVIAGFFALRSILFHY
jgi:hypothetical protein